jgi:hypothetical protein
MRVAMFEGFDERSVAINARRRRLSGYGAFGDAADPRVEEAIRGQIQVMQKVQTTLWEAHNRWATGQFWIGVVIPAARLLQIGKFDWKYAVNSWQSSVDSWWSQSLTDAVRADPSKLDAWTKMGLRIIETAENTAREIGDDGVLRLFVDFKNSFVFVVRTAISQGLKLTTSLIPTWIYYVGAGALAIYLLPFFMKRK